MPLGNWIFLEPGVPERMHFSDVSIIPRTITDVATGKERILQAAVFDVDEHNGQPVHAQFSTIAEKLFQRLEPYIEGKKYLGYDFTITVSGEGFRRTFTVLVTPRR